jgi:hypothetical protein
MKDNDYKNTKKNKRKRSFDPKFITHNCFQFFILGL